MASDNQNLKKTQELKDKKKELLRMLLWAMILMILVGFVGTRPPKGILAKSIPPQMDDGPCGKANLEKLGVEYCSAGTAVLFYENPEAFSRFMFNTYVCFVASFCITTFLWGIWILGISPSWFILKLFGFATPAIGLYLCYAMFSVRLAVGPDMFP